MNSRPLDYGFRQNPNIRTVEDTPASLYQMLLSGKLDTALISSVECIRNEDKFSYCKSAGVCSKSEVSSILYLTSDPNRAPDYFLSDNGSRTSVALLQILLYKKFGKIIPNKKSDPEKIPDQISASCAGLIIGDIAYSYNQLKTDTGIFKIDLGKWWHDEEKLPFVYALWAYPKEKPLEDSFFEKSLEYGLSHMDDIIENSKDLKMRTYLTETLHYRIGKEELKALDRFKNLLLELDLLSAQNSI